ncbi:zinc ribbon domain-containing protein [Methanosphaerula palustris]|uniref:zinc ribbon domain-containing protein n=1 Tax=Methanosphaerula palustris TaxID=475088 RepID=UPI00373AEC47
MKQCPNCGTEVQDGWVACPKCTINLKEAERIIGCSNYVAPNSPEGSTIVVNPIPADPTICPGCGEEQMWSRTILIRRRPGEQNAEVILREELHDQRKMAPFRILGMWFINERPGAVGRYLLLFPVNQVFVF